MEGQNGAVLKQSTKIAVTGCPKVKAKKVTKRHKAKKGHKAKGSAKRGRSVETVRSSVCEVGVVGWC